METSPLGREGLVESAPLCTFSVSQGRRVKPLKLFNFINVSRIQMLGGDGVRKHISLSAAVRPEKLKFHFDSECILSTWSGV